MTPTQEKIINALGSGPLNYYELMAKVEARVPTVDKAVMHLLNSGELEEVKMGQAVGLRLKTGNTPQRASEKPA